MNKNQITGYDHCTESQKLLHILADPRCINNVNPHDREAYLKSQINNEVNAELYKKLYGCLCELMRQGLITANPEFINDKPEIITHKTIEVDDYKLLFSATLTPKGFDHVKQHTPPRSFE